MSKRTENYNLAVINPSLAKGWHPKKNGCLGPTDVTPGSNRKIWWFSDRGHEWIAKVSSRGRGTGCPYCSGYKVSRDSCLKTVNPALAKEWHPIKNGSKSPYEVSPSFNKRAWWMCEKGHEWQASVIWRNKGYNCPYCRGRPPVGKNYNLEVVYARLAAQWHPQRNGSLTPRDVGPFSRKKVWWICAKGHEYQAIIANRSKGRGCPYCAGRAVCKDNCLEEVNPALATEWHPEKNSGLTTRQVTSGSKKKMWWICKKGHEWEAIINNRNRGRGCPYCAGQKKWIPKKASNTLVI